MAPSLAFPFDLPQFATIVAFVDAIIIVVTLPWILTIKKEATSALAWCLVVLLIPLVGFLLFVIFGYNHVYRPLRRKRRHRARFLDRHPSLRREGLAEEVETEKGRCPLGLDELAVRLGAFPPRTGNRVELYHDTDTAFAALCDAIENAEHHVHLEFFIIHPDSTGKHILELLEKKARQGVEVRLLYDAIGSRWLWSWILRPLRKAGGRCAAFLSFNLLRRRIQVNLRNHRKIAVIDGRIGFTGGMNLGDEYLHKDPRFGYWRDAFLRLEGPSTGDLQRIFMEDWDFAAGETLKGERYFPPSSRPGDVRVQVIDSGPDREVNAIRELIFAAITLARERLWISTPYIVPDSGILDALRLAARLGVDVRLMWLFRPDQWLPYFAARYYLPDLLSEGVRIYQYSKGMMHAKMMMVDGTWGWVGSSNLDNRSLQLNFEANCIFHDPDVVAELEAAFVRDMKESIRMDGQAFAGRPYAMRLVENACRLLSPLL